MKRGIFLLAGAGLAMVVGVAPAYAGTTFTVSVTHSPSPMLIGQNGTITISVTSAVSEAASSTITDDVPNALTVTDVTSADFTCSHAGQAVTCTRSSTPTGTAHITITVNPTAAGSYDDTATLCEGQVSELVPSISRGATVCDDAHGSDTILVVAPPRSPTPTPSARHTPTPAPTPAATHHHSAAPAATPTATVKATTATRSLPATGPPQAGRLVAVAVALVAIGVNLTVQARRTSRAG
jgi:hypothetical protein